MGLEFQKYRHAGHVWLNDKIKNFNSDIRNKTVVEPHPNSQKYLHVITALKVKKNSFNKRKKAIKKALPPLPATKTRSSENINSMLKKKFIKKNQ